ncbi:MAG: DNA polymerase IV [Gammaproteobacteria bacterium]|jgi:DNA polymerase-4
MTDLSELLTKQIAFRVSSAGKKIIHVDMDCFYAAIEIRDNPKLKNKPIAVGGNPDERGVICSCNYIARKFGVHSAMATARALRACPKLILLPVNMSKYREASKIIHEIFLTFTDLVEPLSLDEAYLDVTNCKHYCGSATMIAKSIRDKINWQLKLTASAGIAPNKLLAKIASDWNKPNGQFVIIPNEVANFMRTLPIEKIFGIGKVTAKKFATMNIKTCADLQKLSLADLIKHFGNFGAKLYELCRGIDHREVQPNRARKSLSVEETFTKDLSTKAECLAQLPKLITRLTRRLDPNLKIKNQFIKIKFHDFTQTTVECISTNTNLKTYEQLLIEGINRQQQPVRLIGIGVRFQPEELNQQLELGDFLS